MSITFHVVDRKKRRLYVEFFGFYVITPLVVALFLPPTAMFPVLLGFTSLGLALLHITPGFDWRDLGQGWGEIDWRVVGLFAAITAAVSYIALMALHPDALFFVWRMNPGVWLMVMVLYPLLSALPQEVVFRPLFFRRYAEILPPTRAALVLNAALFSLAHLMYWNWLVAAMTLCGGIVFAWAYEKRGSFALAVVLHAVAGNILFTIGTGMFFFSGAVDQPF